MAILVKSKARNNLAVSPVTIGYGNYPVPGLLESRHVALHVSNETHSYILKMTLPEAAEKAIQMLRYAMEHGDVKLEWVDTMLRKEDRFTKWKPE